MYKELEIRHLAPIIFVIFIYISPILALTANDSRISDQDFMKVDLITAESRYSQGSAFFEYMPVKAKADIPYVAMRGDKAIVTEGEAEIDNEVKQGTTLRFEVLAKIATQIELPYLYYLGWYATIESDKGIIRLETFESAKGFVGIDIPANMEGSVSVLFKGTIMTRVAYFGSFIAFIALAWILLRKLKRDVTVPDTGL